MRPEDKEDDYIEDKEAGNEDTEETTETDKDAAEQDGGATVHSDYKVPDKGDARMTYHLSGMYQNWFLDYASYVILERAVPHINDGLKPVQRRRWPTSWGTRCSSTRTATPPSATHWCSWGRKSY